MMLNASLVDGHAPLGIALSGGGDSTALLVLLVDHIGAQNLCAVTIDHGLRAEAKSEAQRAKELCVRLGVAHETRALSLKDGTDLQARARVARYGALCEWAKLRQIKAIALGHTKEDVAETFLMRLARGSGVDGLAQMPEQFHAQDQVFLRPLLAVSRVELRSFLKARKIDWSDDPSNSDMRFSRVKMRNAQPELDRLGLTTDRLTQTAQWMRSASIVLEQAADQWIAAHTHADYGDAVINRAALKEAPEETAARVISRVLCTISSNPYRPRLSALRALVYSDIATTLHGCLAYPHKETLRITREFNALSEDGTDQGRWHIKGPLTEHHRIKPLGDVGLRHIPDWRQSALLPRRSLLASPAVWLEETLVAAPLAKPDLNWRASVANPLHLSK